MVGGQAGLRRGLNCIGEFRQRGQVVSWMTTSEAVAHRGGAGGGGRALGSQHGRKGALLFSGGWEGGERQEGRGRAGASRDGGAGGHDCGGEREAAVVSSVSGRSHQKLWPSHGQNSHLKHFVLFFFICCFETRLGRLEAFPVIPLVDISTTPENQELQFASVDTCPSSCALPLAFTDLLAGPTFLRVEKTGRRNVDGQFDDSFYPPSLFCPFCLRCGNT